MSIQYIEPFVDATVNVMKELFGLEAAPGRPFLIRRDECADWNVSGIIGIAGDSRGVVVISYGKDSAAALTARLLGTAADAVDINVDVLDAVGEVVNIVAGNAKKGLEQYRLTISLPSVVLGTCHQIKWPQGVPIVAIPFECDLGRFQLSVGLENVIREI